jgi:hypothetical protein
MAALRDHGRSATGEVSCRSSQAWHRDSADRRSEQAANIIEAALKIESLRRDTIATTVAGSP